LVAGKADQKVASLELQLETIPVAQRVDWKVAPTVDVSVAKLAAEKVDQMVVQMVV